MDADSDEIFDDDSDTPSELDPSEELEDSLVEYELISPEQNGVKNDAPPNNNKEAPFEPEEASNIWQ